MQGSEPCCCLMWLQGNGLDGFVHAVVQLVDDMAALLAASVLQLLGGACSNRAAADQVLQASFREC